VTNLNDFHLTTNIKAMKAPPTKNEDIMLEPDSFEHEIDRIRLQNPGCDPHEIESRASMADSLASSAHSGPSLESSRYSVEMEGPSQTTLVLARTERRRKRRRTARKNW